MGRVAASNPKPEISEHIIMNLYSVFTIVIRIIRVINVSNSNNNNDIFQELEEEHGPSEFLCMKDWRGVFLLYSFDNFLLQRDYRVLKGLGFRV